ncbi:MAG: serine/threonine protein kinase [Acidobacteria bacterium]|nr:serine/threonine protein kinase [Acidobacteriota bacterium]
MNKIGKYEIRSELGRGAMGIVYLGYDPVIERSVAIKTMNAEAFEEEEQKQRFLREARSAGAMQHPNIVTIYEMGMEGDTPYIAMEYVEGQDLTRLVKKGEPESLKEKLSIMAQLCDALHFAHLKEVIHRDIKPGNIRILPDGTVKIMDFGIAKKQDSDFTRTGLVVGTLSYMSPEQVQGKPLDPRSDQFSAGVVFYQMLTGKKPFGGDNLTNVIYQIISFNVNTLELPGTPTVLKKIVQKMMNPDPEKRFRTCGEVSGLLRQEIQFLEGDGEAPTVLIETDTGAPDQTAVGIPPIPPSTPVSVPRRKKNIPVILLVLLLFAAVLGVAGFWGYKRFIRPRKTIQHVNQYENKVVPPVDDSLSKISRHKENTVGTDTKNSQNTENENTLRQAGRGTETEQAENSKPVQTARTEPPRTQKLEPVLKKTVQAKRSSIVPKTQPEKKTVPKSKPETHSGTYPTAETVFKKEGQGRRVLALNGIFSAYGERIARFKKRVANMPFAQRRGMFNREMNMGRMALSQSNKIPAAVHFYRATILQPGNKDGYAWLVATLVDLKAYGEAKKVIRKAGEHGISPSTMNSNMRFRIAYQKLQMH